MQGCSGSRKLKNLALVVASIAESIAFAELELRFADFNRSH
jgi:hypothetical protein